MGKSVSKKITMQGPKITANHLFDGSCVNKSELLIQNSCSCNRAEHLCRPPCMRLRLTVDGK